MGLKLPIFMDSQSTTPVDPRVLEVMIPYFTEKFGHPASRNHPFGWEAEGAVDHARDEIARLIGARDPKEVVFTSGGTESINLALKGVAEMYREKGNHIVTTTIEQRASMDVGKRLERQGFEVTYVSVGPDGLVDPSEIEKAITPKTILVSVMFANNEIGTIQPIAEIGKLAKGKGIVFHTDATQAAGKVPIDVEAMGIDLLSLTAHMMYGPKGVGALYVRRKGPRVRIAPMMDGGGHERGMRSGTVPVPLAVGFGRAAAISREVMPEESKRLASAARPPAGAHSGEGGRGIRERQRRTASAAQLEHLVCVRGRRVRPDGAQQGSGPVVGVGLHVGNARALVRHLRARRRRRARPLVDPLRPPPVQHGGRGRVRGAAHGRGGPAAARDVAAVRAGERRRGSSIDQLEGGIAAPPGRRGGRATMAYSDKVIDHYSNPRNVGSFTKDTPGVGTGLVGAPECGDVMKLQIKVNVETGVIEDAKFKTFGCGSAIASSSLATEWLKGKTVDDAAKIKNTDIVNELKLPPVKIHCSVLAEDAIKAALQDYKEKWVGTEAPVGKSAS